MSKEAMKLEQRITDYLSAGGLFNPELADHVAVRDLLIDCRKALAEQPVKSNLKQVIELYDSPDQPAQQEPVAWGCNRYIEDYNGFQIGTDEPELAWGKYAPDDNGWWPLYTAPPQRKPLTDEEIDLLINGRGDVDDADYVEPTGDGFGLTDADLVRLVRRVEASHDIKDKNNA